MGSSVPDRTVSETLGITTSISGFLNDLGVALFEGQDAEGFSQQYTETTSTALVALFACLPSPMGRSLGSSAQALRLPRSIERVVFRKCDPEQCPEGTLQELLHGAGLQAFLVDLKLPVAAVET